MTKRVLWLIAVLVMAVGLAGCGGDDDETGAQGTGETEEGTPVKGGILRVGSINYIDSLNPFNYIESQAYQAMLMIFPQLVQIGGPGLFRLGQQPIRSGERVAFVGAHQIAMHVGVGRERERQQIVLHRLAATALGACGGVHRAHGRCPFRFAG